MTIKVLSQSLSEKFLLRSERLFKDTAKLTQDISRFPLKKTSVNTAINKEKSKEFSEVFTPLWLVDKMINQVEWDHCNMQTLDLCAGYGQFSIRVMRFMYNTFPNFDVRKFIKDNHAFSELQLSSCYKLLNIFGNSITLFIGDSTYLNKLPVNARGIWCYIESYGYWVCLTKTISGIIFPNGTKEKPISQEKFVDSVESIVLSLNETYTSIKNMLNLSLQQMTVSPKLRLALISQITSTIKKTSPENTPLQLVDTPQSIVDDMLVGVEDIEKKSILVLYNCEIVENLISKKKIDPKNITFGVEYAVSLKATAMKQMYGVDTTLVDAKCTNIHSAFGGRKFDLCLSNPPYNRGLDLKILLSLMGDGTEANSVAKEFVFVHPSTWLLDQKDIFPLYSNVKSILVGKLKSVYFFNGYKAFKCEGLDTCVVTHIDLCNVSAKTKISFEDSSDEKFEVQSLSDITKFGKSWILIVKSFASKIKATIKVNGNVWSHNTKCFDSKKEYCQLAAIIGHTSKDGSAKVKDDFFTLTMKNTPEENKGVRQSNLNRPGNPTPTFGFDSSMERDNFLEYLNTDFARFCLALLKAGKNAATGEMSLIPWLDFTQAWDDEKLFKHFDINQETQDYIRKFLPDYYGIRKPAKAGKQVDGNQTQTLGLQS